MSTVSSGVVEIPADSSANNISSVWLRWRTSTTRPRWVWFANIIPGHTSIARIVRVGLLFMSASISNILWLKALMV
jgi:hypothetical protein